MALWWLYFDQSAEAAAAVVAAVAASDRLPWLARRRPVELGLAPDAAVGIDLNRS